MDGFGYLVMLVSVVAGLGLTHALSGMARIVQSRQDVRVSGVHLAWTGSILLWLVSYWWFTFLFASIERWTVPLLIFILIYGSLIYFLIALLYPDKWASGENLLEHFIASRRWFFGAFVTLGILDIADTWVKTVLYDLPPPPMIPYYILMVSWLTFGITGAITTNRLYHKTIAYAWLVVFGSWALALFAIGG